MHPQSLDWPVGQNIPYKVNLSKTHVILMYCIFVSGRTALRGDQRMYLLLLLDQGTGVSVQVNHKGQRWTCPASSKQLKTNKRERHTVWLATSSNCTDNANSMKKRGKAVTLRRQWSIGSRWNLWGCRTTSVHPTGAPKIWDSNTGRGNQPTGILGVVDITRMPGICSELDP